MASKAERGHKQLPDITQGVIWKQILVFFFPILFGTFFQQMYNTVDAIIVGRFLGKEALAAVGGGTGTVVNLLVGFFMGLSSGSTVVISQFYGAKRERDVHKAVHTSIAIAIAGGLIITVAGIFYAPWMLRILGTPNDILEPAVIYIRIFFAGILPTIIYNMGSGILRAVGDSQRPLYFLIVGTFLNIFLDLLFIAVFNWGVQGAAAATIISQTITMILVLVCLMRTTDCYKLYIRDISFDIPILKKTLQIGFPAGIQSVMYTVSNLIIQANVNVFGTNTIAAWAAYGKIDTIFWMAINSFGIAATTFTGQNFGAGKMDRVRKGVRECFLMAGLGTIAMSAAMIAGGRYFLALFTTDQAVIDEGMRILNFITPTFITYVAIEILSGAIRGCGKALIPMIITCGGVCSLRIIWLAIAMPVNSSIITVCASYPISWSITGTMFFIYYFYLIFRVFNKKNNLK